MRHGEKVSLTGEKATLLITLFGKAEESRLPDSLLKDHLAAVAVSRIDYDFSKLKVRLDDAIGLAIRAHALDSWTREFLAQHPEAAGAVLRVLGPSGVAEQGHEDAAGTGERCRAQLAPR